jgi:hypothetical protein
MAQIISLDTSQRRQKGNADDICKSVNLIHYNDLSVFKIF